MQFKNIFNKKAKKISYSGETPKKETDFNFGLIEYYFKNKNHSSALQIVDDQLVNDMDLNELFMYVDRTHSKIGQQYLYNRLRVVNNVLDFDEQETVIDYFTKHEVEQIKVQSLLSKLNKWESYYISNLFLDQYIEKPKWFWIIKILSIVSFTLLIFTVLYPKIVLLLLFIYIINTFVHFWNKNNILVYSDSITQLPLLCNIAKLFTSMDIFSESKQSVLSSVASINELKYMFKLFKLDLGTKSEINALFRYPWEMIKILFLIEPLMTFHVLKKLEVKKKEVQTVFEYIGKIDSAISIASLRTSVPYYCTPTLLNTHKNTLDFTDIYHPLIPDCISNSLQIQNKSILLTGSNMSGKTTFIRTVALNILLAQTLHTCFAKTFKLSQTRLFSAIRITDDLLSSKSYYFEEVLAIKNMISESRADSRNIFLLDEIFKGTNTVERIAAGKAVLSYLAKSENNRIFVSTHDIELVDLLKDAYDLYHFTEVIQGEQIYFDYTLKKGALTTKNAIRILEINDYPQQVVDEAREISIKIGG